jgi:hypothetical protein
VGMHEEVEVTQNIVVLFDSLILVFISYRR